MHLYSRLGTPNSFARKTCAGHTRRPPQGQQKIHLTTTTSSPHGVRTSGAEDHDPEVAGRKALVSLRLQHVHGRGVKAVVAPSGAKGPLTALAAACLDSCRGTRCQSTVTQRSGFVCSTHPSTVISLALDKARRSAGGGFVSGS